MEIKYEKNKLLENVHKEKAKERKENKEKESAANFEYCVCCRKKLLVPVDEPIDYRAFYVEGAGQLCYDCYHQIYK